MLKSGLPALAIAALLAVSPALSQTSDSSELSAKELESLFQKQKTRGLVLAPTNPAAKPEAPETTAATPVAAPTTYVETEKDLAINIQIKFDFDSAALRTDQKPKLTNLCEAMRNVDVELFRIVGHTDSSGSASYNERLSLLRAQEVKRHMVSECGIAETRLEAVGVGEQFPFDKSNPRADENRRVEFQALG